MKRMITVLALAATMLLATASVALAGSADGPTCYPMWENHGEHITGDYVNPGSPGGAYGHAAHFDHPSDVGPGASFCLEQAQADSPSGGPGTRP